MATRYTTPTSPLTKSRVRHLCPTCGRQRVLDGKLGMYQIPSFCQEDCYGRLRAFNAQRSFLKLGAAYASTVSPFTPGSVSK